MSASNPSAVTNKALGYMPVVIATYGNGPGTSGLAVGGYAPTAVERFRAESPNFQATLYRGPDGKFVVAIASGLG